MEECLRINRAASIDSLPDEVLYSIFECCPRLHGRIPFIRSRQTDNFKHITSLDPRHISWRLSQVSRRWRALAISLPCLWSHINIHIPVPPYATEKISTILRHTANSDLFIRVVYVQGRYAHQFSSILPLLSLTANRWKHLELVTVDLSILSHLSGCIFDRLTYLDIQAHGTLIALEPLAAFKNAPLLTHVRMPAGLVIHLPWKNITNFSCTPCSFSGALGCYIPKLPALQELSLETNLIESDALFVVPIATLETLNMKGIRPRGFIPFLAALDSITAIYLSASFMQDDMLDALCVSRHSSILLPKLTRLCIDEETMQCHLTRFLDMMESRLSGSIRQDVAILKELRIVKPLKEDLNEFRMTLYTQARASVRWRTISKRVNAIYVLENTF